MNCTVSVGPQKAFMWRDFVLDIGTGVFVPSSSTNFLCHYLNRAEIPVSGKKVLILGCGSGPEALVLGKQAPKRIVALDLDANSVQCSKDNFTRYYDGSQIEAQFIQSDRFSSLKSGDTFDLIVCNPPAVDLEVNDIVKKRVACSGTNFVTASISDIRRLSLLTPHGMAIFVVSNTSDLRKIFLTGVEVGLIPYVLAAEGYPPPYQDTLCVLLAFCLPGGLGQKPE